MRILSYIPFGVICLLGLYSCVDEKLAECPSEDSEIAVTLRVEKFMTRSPYRPGDLEGNFGGRIHSLYYLLYSDEELIEQGFLEDASADTDGSYLFRHEMLPPGAYRLAFVANATPGMMTGKVDDPEAYYIVYQGENEGEDHFRADMPFEITGSSRRDLQTVLLRVYGVTRFSFENVPQEVTAIEITLDNVGERMPICGDPDVACEVTKLIGTPDLGSRTSGTYTLGTFCTLPGVKTSWRMKMYGQDSTEPIFNRVVTDTLRIECNQLLDLKVRFREDDIEFSAEIDTSWDGSNEAGGGTEI